MTTHKIPQDPWLNNQKQIQKKERKETLELINKLSKVIRNKKLCSYKNLYLNFYKSIICSSQNLEKNVDFS